MCWNPALLCVCCSSLKQLLSKSSGKGKGFGKGQGFGKGRSSGKGKSFGKGMAAQGRGGPRHHMKPYVDSGLIYKVLADCPKLLADMGAYEHLSRSNAPNARGLLETMALWKGLLKLESSGEIHSQPLRHALISLLAENPKLNTGSHTGQVWANLKLERIGTILFHVRKLGRDKESKLQTAAAKLRREEFEALKNGLLLLDQPFDKPEEERPDTALVPLEKGSSQEQEGLPLEKGTKVKQEGLPLEKGKKLKLKKNESDVSLNSQGFPAMFDSPELDRPKKVSKTGAAVLEEKKEEAASRPVAFERRRIGQKTAPLHAGALSEALGFGTGKKQQPAAVAKARGQKKPQEKKVAVEKEIRKPWVKIRRTEGKNPARAYLCGTHEAGGKLRLIVEVTAKRCPGYLQIIEQLWKSLEKDSLTKAEAGALKEKLCAEWDC